MTSLNLKPDWYLRSRLRLRHLHLLIVLDDVKNVGEAARRLATTQPAVSRMLAELEEMVGTLLFNRTSKGTFATPHGESMIRHARWVLGDLERMGQDWAEPGGLLNEKVVLGINSSSAAFLVPNALVRFQQEREVVTVVVREGSIETLLPDLFTRKLDLIVARLGATTYASDLVQKILYEEPMCICCSVEHPLARKSEYAWQDLANHPWILPPAGSPVRVGLDMLFQRYGIIPRGRVESASMLNNMVLMDKSMALCLMPVAVATYHAERHRLVMLSIDLPLVFGPIGVIHHASLDLSASMKHLVKCFEIEAALMTMVPSTSGLE